MVYSLGTNCNMHAKVSISSMYDKPNFWRLKNTEALPHIVYTAMHTAKCRVNLGFVQILLKCRIDKDKLSTERAAALIADGDTKNRALTYGLRL